MADNDQNDPMKRFKDMFNSVKKFISEDLERLQNGQFDYSQNEQPQQPPQPPKPAVRRPKGKGGSFEL